MKRENWESRGTKDIVHRAEDQRRESYVETELWRSKEVPIKSSAEYQLAHVYKKLPEAKG